MRPDTKHKASTADIKPNVFNFVGAHLQPDHHIALTKEIAGRGAVWQAVTNTEEPVVVNDRVLIAHTKGFAMYRVVASGVARFGRRQIVMTYDEGAVDDWLKSFGDRGVSKPSLAAQTATIELLPKRSDWPFTAENRPAFASADTPLVRLTTVTKQGWQARRMSAAWLVNDVTGEAILVGPVLYPSGQQIQKLYEKHYQKISQITRCLVHRVQDKELLIGSDWRMTCVMRMRDHEGGVVYTL